MQDMLQGPLHFVAHAPHVWWGVSVEDRKYGLPRIAHLRSSPATVRFLSVEPLLEDVGQVDLTGIHWVIVGGESGAGARPMQKIWVESIRDQCERAGIAFFFKQWGGVQKKKTGRELNGRTYNEQPPRRVFPIPDAARRKILCEEVERALGFLDKTRSRG
jgi:protein gp37